MFRTALTLFMSSLAIPALASMRCGTHLVDEGDSVEQVAFIIGGGGRYPCFARR